MLEKPESPRRKVLLLGAAGHVGQCLLQAWQSDFAMCYFDREAVAGCSGVQGELTDRAALRQAMQGIDVAVHLAATRKEAPFVEDLVPNNVIGLYNVFEAAREAGVKRLIFASSAQSVAAYPAKCDITVADPPRPSSLYGAAKVLGEAMGRYYFDHHGLEFIAIRIGWLLPGDSPVLRRNGYGRQIWISERDVVQLFRCAIESPVGYAVVFGVSKTQGTRLSLCEARTLGYEPQDDVRSIAIEPEVEAIHKKT